MNWLLGVDPRPRRERCPLLEADRQEAWLAQRRGRTERHRQWSVFR